jgi:hypothetical protein
MCHGHLGRAFLFYLAPRFFLWISAPKGHHISAQGNALGENVSPPVSQPSRAFRSRSQRAGANAKSPLPNGKHKRHKTNCVSFNSIQLHFLMKEAKSSISTKSITFL